MTKKNAKTTSRLGSDPFADSLPFIRDTRADNEDKPSKQENDSMPVSETIPVLKPSKQKKASDSAQAGAKRGRPRGPGREITSKSQAGLPLGWTRATFIVREDLLERLKDYAYWERLQTKQVVNTAMEAFLKGKHIKPREQ